MYLQYLHNCALLCEQEATLNEIENDRGLEAWKQRKKFGSPYVTDLNVFVTQKIEANKREIKKRLAMAAKNTQCNVKQEA